MGVYRVYALGIIGFRVQGFPKSGFLLLGVLIRIIAS